jgi:phosphate acetyltransferase
MIVSSSFLIELDHCDFGEHGLFIFADCGIIPDPKARQLAGIAISASELLYSLFGIEPKVAMLSYSTKGSAHGESVDKVIEALRIIKEAKPGMKADGEFQLDAAIVPEVAKIKAPESSVAGKANVLIFPNLDAGNISYKLMQRLGKARVVGPLLQGLTQPASDLSRGCEIEEIMDAVTVTAIRAQKIHPHTN